MVMFSQWGLGAPNVTFKDSYLRYLSGHDFFRVLNQKFPDAQYGNNADCMAFSNSNRGITGDLNPATGDPMYRGPSVTFVKWYIKCVMLAVGSQFDQSLAKASGMEPFFGKKALQMLSTQPYAAVVTSPKSVTWMTLSPDIQTQIVNNLFEYYVGRNIIQNQDELCKKMLTATQDKSLTTFDALKQLVLLVTTQDEFLTY